MANYHTLKVVFDRLLNLGFLACSTRMSGPYMLALERSIKDFVQWVPCTCHVLDLKILLKFERSKEEVPNFYFKFQNKL
jgi:hypothetical protein